MELVDVHDAYSAGAAEMTSAGASSAGGAGSGLPTNLKKPAKPWVSGPAFHITTKAGVGSAAP